MCIRDRFEKVRMGEIRILLGSTSKLGTGTNVQDRLIAVHHLDCPWRPSDINQRDGRILRQGNQNPVIKILRYVTKGTFDSYLYQITTLRESNTLKKNQKASVRTFK